MRPSTIEPNVWHLLGRRAEARLARAGERAASAARNAGAASDDVDAACAELTRIDGESACAREALRVRVAKGTEPMSRKDFERLDPVHARLEARRSHARAMLDEAQSNRDAALAALAEARDTRHQLLLQREKYRLAEQLSAAGGIDDAI